MPALQGSLGAAGSLRAVAKEQLGAGEDLEESSKAAAGRWNEGAPRVGTTGQTPSKAPGLVLSGLYWEIPSLKPQHLYCTLKTSSRNVISNNPLKKRARNSPSESTWLSRCRAEVGRQGPSGLNPHVSTWSAPGNAP